MSTPVQTASSTLTQQISCYMILSLFHRLNIGSNPAGVDHGLSYDILKDCEMIVTQVHQAFNNPSKPRITTPRRAEKLTFQ
jgi:hypothetical protein